MPHSRSRRGLLVALVAPVLALQSLPAQAPARDLLVLLRGTDTIAVERFVRTASRLDGEMLLKAANARFTFSVDVAADGGAVRLENAFRQATADVTSSPMQSAVVRFTGDSAIVDLTGGAGTMTQRFGTRPGAVPFLNPSFSLVELILQRARRIGGDSVQVPVWSLQGGATFPVPVRWKGRDSVLITIGNVDTRLAVNARGDITGGIVPSQGLRLLRVRGGDASAMSAEPPDYSVSPLAPYTAEEVSIPTPGGHTLAGTLTMPKEARGRVPAIITITGSGPEDRDEALPGVKDYRPFRQVADTLGRIGIAVLRMDDRGFGVSTGNHATATSADFADDIRAGLAYLRARNDIDATRLGLVGHSEGGLVAPMVAADTPDLRGIVLMAGPSRTGRSILEYQLRFGIEAATQFTATQKDSALRAIQGTIATMASAQPWMAFFIDYDPLITARRVQVPTLILQGETDRQVTADQAEELARAIREGGNRYVSLRVFPLTNHLFLDDADGAPTGYATLPSRDVRRDVLCAIADFFRVRMQ
ncbi:MAG: alpha/beta fold hydrolase [Gemmatimonadaceae bacterium]